MVRHRTLGLKHRVAGIFRQAAPALARGNNSLGAFYRKIRGRCGGPAAVTATAHKLARIFYHLVTTKKAYDAAVFAEEAKRQQERRLKALDRQAKSLGYCLAPLPEKAATPV